MSAVGARVSPQWLALREPADAAARSAELAERVARRLPAGRLVIHDLGGGSGAMGRWLAPRLPGPQHWVVHDRDPDLLALATAAAGCVAVAVAGGCVTVETRRSDIARLTSGDPAAGGSVTVETRRSDIARLASGDLAGASLVTASALLDVLTAEELAAMLRACAGLPLLLALTVTGRVALRPADPLDQPIEAAFNAHQRRAGRLGPDAVAAAAAELRGAELHVRPSPWRLGAADAGLVAEWLDGWVAAACEQEPPLAAEAGAYRDRRLAQLAAGELAVTVEHADLLALP